MILRNHGLLTCAGTIADAFLFMFIMQRACEIQLKAQATGQKLIPIHSAILQGIKAQAAQVTKQAGGSLAWPGIKRRVERRFPGFDA